VNAYAAGPITPAKWIGARPTNISTSLEWWDFQICFCLCSGAQNVRLNITGAGVDDTADFKLNNCTLGSLNWTQSGIAPAAAIAAINNNATATCFQSGQNCLRVRLTNTQPNVAQWWLAGTITGADAICP
jgi:hypothetical protein